MSHSSKRRAARDAKGWVEVLLLELGAGAQQFTNLTVAHRRWWWLSAHNPELIHPHRTRSCSTEGPIARVARRSSGASELEFLPWANPTLIATWLEGNAALMVVNVSLRMGRSLDHWQPGACFHAPECWAEVSEADKFEVSPDTHALSRRHDHRED